jgi:hypothetical protein
MPLSKSLKLFIKSLSSPDTSVQERMAWKTSVILWYEVYTKATDSEDSNINAWLTTSTSGTVGLDLLNYTNEKRISFTFRENSVSALLQKEGYYHSGMMFTKGLPFNNGSLLAYFTWLTT